MLFFRRWRKFFIFLGGLFACAVLFAVAVALTTSGMADLPKLNEGDIVFQTSDTPQSLAIMLATRSLYSHMGLVTVDRDGSVFVIETGVGGKRTRLDDWIKRGRLGRILVKRVKWMDILKKWPAVRWAEKNSSLPEDFYFLSDNRAFYCSELVHDAYFLTTGVKIGRVQKMGDLSFDNFAVRKLLKERWKSHPGCKNAATLDDCRATIMEGSIVTPTAMARDKKLETVYSNYPF